MKKLLFVVWLFTGLTIFVTSQGFAEDTKRELEELKIRIEELEKKAEKQEEKSRQILGGIAEKIRFYGTVELDFSYADDSDTADNTVNDSTSDLQIGTVELGAEIEFHEYVTGNLLLKGENLDSDDRVFWDEAIITIQKEGFPFYFVGGKRAQPFGVFESHLINDPITQESYEINRTGATFGFTPRLWGLDISATVYRGEVLAGKLYDAGFGLTRSTSPTYAETDDVSSYIGNISASPFEDLTLALFWDSEPGDGDRNETIGGMFNLRIWKFTLDAEYMKAKSRERNYADDRAYEESAWFGAVAFRAADPLELAARYEGFDDDRDGDQDGSLEARYSIGANYTLFEKDNFSTTIMAEYRRSNYEKASGSTYDDKLDEFFVRLAIAF
ncbi:MAG: LbtU family siderophore porin [Pseudomonadota bacterium]